MHRRENSGWSCTRTALCRRNTNPRLKTFWKVRYFLANTRQVQNTPWHRSCRKYIHREHATVASQALRQYPHAMQPRRQQAWNGTTVTHTDGRQKEQSQTNFHDKSHCDAGPSLSRARKPSKETQHEKRSTNKRERGVNRVVSHFVLAANANLNSTRVLASVIQTLH